MVLGDAGVGVRGGKYERRNGGWEKRIRGKMEDGRRG